VHLFSGHETSFAHVRLLERDTNAQIDDGLLSLDGWVGINGVMADDAFFQNEPPALCGGHGIANTVCSFNQLRRCDVQLTICAFPYALERLFASVRVQIQLLNMDGCVNTLAGLGKQRLQLIGPFGRCTYLSRPRLARLCYPAKAPCCLEGT